MWLEPMGFRRARRGGILCFSRARQKGESSNKDAAGITVPRRASMPVAGRFEGKTTGPRKLPSVGILGDTAWLGREAPGLVCAALLDMREAYNRTLRM